MAIREDFDATDHFKTRQFPTIHFVILGLVVSDLQTQLYLSTDHIDSTDWQGRTALSWAAAKGDLKSVNLLLEHGADPNISSLNGSTPLMFASRAPNPSCLKPLLAKGARPNEQNSWQMDALNYAMRMESGTRYIMPLLQFGADPSVCDDSQLPPLTRAVRSGHLEQVACLLAYGAQPSERDGWMFGLLESAIYSRTVETVMVLLEHNNMDLERLGMDQLLEMAEEVGDAKVVKILNDRLTSREPLEDDEEPEDMDNIIVDFFFDSVEV